MSTAKHVYMALRVSRSGGGLSANGKEESRSHTDNTINNVSFKLVHLLNKQLRWMLIKKNTLDGSRCEMESIRCKEKLSKIQPCNSKMKYKPQNNTITRQLQL